MRNRILILLMILSILFLRPALLGYEYSGLGLLFSFISFFYYIIFIQGSLQIKKTHLYMLFIFTIMWSYILGSSALNHAIHVDFTLKAFISNVFVFWVFACILSNKLINSLFFKTLVYFMAFLGFSEAISTLLLESVGVDNLLLYKILDYNLLLPFSLEYSVYTVPGLHVFHRFMVFFKEAGLAQAFLSWSLVYIYFYKFPKWTFWGIISGIVLTFSTVAIVNLLLVITLIYVVNNTNSLKKIILRSLLGVVLGVAIMFSTYYFPAIGLKAKSETHGVSLSDRFDNMSYGIQSMLDNPLGTGMYGSIEKNSGINLIAMSNEIGLIGFVLAILIFFLPPLMGKKQNNVFYAISIIPILLTSLVAQPILDSPLVYIFLFATFAQGRIMSRKCAIIR